jgi:hypothetical protein
VLYPDDHSVSDEAQYGAGQALEAQKEWAKAVDAYDKVIASPTAGEWADKARARRDAVKAAHP